MKNLLVSLLLLLSGISMPFYAQTPAFPGAEGFGRYTVGGRGGDVYRVTTLEDNNMPGSLRYAVKQKGARTIIFDVSGTIFLTGELKIQNDYITIAGQTAPGDGICIAGYPVVIAADDVIIRYVRFRMGDDNAVEADALGGMDHRNIIIDHCSVSWSTDECCSVYGNENMTMQWCIISESLRLSVHGKGAHGYGGNWGGNKASYHHNLMAHHDSRTPRLGPRAGTQLNEWMDFRNNVIYNWGANNGCYGGEAMKVNIINNYYKPGPATALARSNVRYRIAKVGIRTTEYVERNPAFAPALHIWGKFYVAGNIMEGYDDVTADNWTKGIYEQISNSECDNLFTEATRDTIRLYEPLEAGYIHTHSASDAYEKVLAYAGCSLSRDEVDARIVEDTRNGSAAYGNSDGYPGLIDTPYDLRPSDAAADWSPWPELQQGTPRIDSDGDGIPDEWERAHGLDPADAADGNRLNAEGYTALEEYINSLVADITEAQYEGATLEYIPEVKLADAVARAQDGDVIELAADEAVNATITIDKSLTIRARDGYRPVLEKVKFIMADGGSLVLDGIVAYYDEADTSEPTRNTFITANDIVDFERLEIRNCEIYGYGESFVQSNNKARYAVIDRLSVENTVLHDFCEARANEPVFGLKYGRVSQVSLAHTSIYNCAGGVFVNEDPDEVTPCPLLFDMRRVTILDCGNAAGSDPESKDIIDLAHKKAAVTATVADCIISGHPDKSLKFTDASASVLHSLVTNNVTGALVNDTRIEGEITQCDYDSYSLATSPADITGIGDPRWTLNGVGAVTAAQHGACRYYTAGGRLVIAGIAPSYTGAVLYDIQGRMVRQEERVSGGEVSFAMPSRGIYIARLGGEAGSASVKVKI